MREGVVYIRIPLFWRSERREVSPTPGATVAHTRREVSLCAGLTFRFAHVSPLTRRGSHFCHARAKGIDTRTTPQK